MRFGLLGILACLAGLALAAQPQAATEAGMTEAGVTEAGATDAGATDAGPPPLSAPPAPPPLPLPRPPAPDAPLSLPLIVTVAPDGTITATGDAPSGFPLAELRSRTPGITITADGDYRPRKTPERMAHVLDALTIVLPRLAEGQVHLSEARLDVHGTLRPGFSAEATRAALRLTLGSGWEARIDLAESPPPAELAVTWSRHGAVVSGILPGGLPPDEALRLLRRPVAGIVEGGLVDAGVTGGGAGDPASWRAALPLVGRVLPAFSHAVARMVAGVGAGIGLGFGTGSLAIEGPLEPGQEAARLEDWLAAELGEAWEVSVTGAGEPAAGEAVTGAVRHDPVTGREQELVGGRWIPLHDFAPDPAACRLRASAILAAEPLRFVSGGTELEPGAAGTLDRLAGVARRCLNRGGLSLVIGGHTDSRGAAEENLALSEARAMKVLVELVARGVRADAMEAVGHGEARAVAGNDTEEGRARNRRITFDWSG